MATYVDRKTPTRRLQVSLSLDLYDAVMETSQANDISASLLVNRIIRQWYLEGGPITIEPTGNERIA